MSKKKSASKSSTTKIISIYLYVNVVISIIWALKNIQLLMQKNIDAFQTNYVVIIITQIIYLTLLFILVFKPRCWQLITISHVFVGCVGMVLGGSCTILGCLFFIIGWIIAYRFGFFKTYFVTKLIIVNCLFVPAAAVGTILQQGLQPHLLLYAAAWITSNFILFFILWDKTKTDTVQVSATTEGEKVINLETYDFTPNELYALAATLRDETYYAISLHLKISESAVKKMMLGVYSKFGCKNRELFLSEIKKTKLLYPRWFTLYNSKNK